MNENYQLGSTNSTVTVDQDEVRVSFGCDNSEIHCWTCGSADAMESGAWIISKPLKRDADTASYWADRYPDMPADERTQTLVCLDCQRSIDPRDKITTYLRTDSQVATDAEWALAGIGAN